METEEGEKEEYRTEFEDVQETRESDQEKESDKQTDGVVIEEIIDEEIVRNIDEARQYKVNGNSLFKKGDYKGAIDCYRMAQRYCPLDDEYNKDRSIFFCNIAASQIELKSYEDAVDSSNRSIELDPTYTKAYVRREQAYEALEKLDDALADYDKILELDGSAPGIRRKREELKKQIDERNEKMKTEMIGKLKDVGNKLLGKFGMSLDNFKMVQDPATGGYSIKYEQ